MKTFSVVLIFMLILPISYSLSIKEVLSRYSFSVNNDQAQLLNSTDVMIDSDNNGINDQLIIELHLNNSAGNYYFHANLLDKDAIVSLEENKTLASGKNKLNLSISTHYLTKNKFNYSITIYNSSHNLILRKDKIETNPYFEYEKSFGIIDVKDRASDNGMLVDVLVNSSQNINTSSALTVSYNNSFIQSKRNFTFFKGINNITFIFDNETMKSTHFRGQFTLSKIKTGKSISIINKKTSNYDFEDFANTSYRKLR